MHKSILCHGYDAIKWLLKPCHWHTEVRSFLLPIVILVGLVRDFEFVTEDCLYSKFVQTEEHEGHRVFELQLLRLRARVHAYANTPPGVAQFLF